MKIKNLSIFVLVILLSITAIGSFVSSNYMENPSKTVVEYVELESKVQHESDETATFSQNILQIINQDALNHTFHHTLYSFKSNNALFKPPIFSYNSKTTLLT